MYCNCITAECICSVAIASEKKAVLLLSYDYFTCWLFSLHQQLLWQPERFSQLQLQPPWLQYWDYIIISVVYLSSADEEGGYLWFRLVPPSHPTDLFLRPIPVQLSLEKWDSWIRNILTLAMESRSLSISLNVFVPNTFRRVVWASRRVENWASFTFVTEITWNNFLWRSHWFLSKRGCFQKKSLTFPMVSDFRTIN